MLEEISKFLSDANGKDLVQSNMLSSSMIDGMIKCQLASEQTKRAAQTAITKIIEQCLASEQVLLDYMKAMQTDNTEKTTLTQKPAFVIEYKKIVDDMMDTLNKLKSEVDTLNKQKSQAPSSVAKNNAFFLPTEENTGANNQLPVPEVVGSVAAPVAKQSTPSI